MWKSCSSACIALTFALTVWVVPAHAAPPTRVTATEAGAPPTRTIEPGRLARGPDARVDFMQDGVIHTARGRTLSLRTPVDRDERQLLGRSGRGWLVAVRKGVVNRVVAVRRGRAPVELPKSRHMTYVEGDAGIGWLLSRDGRMLLDTTFDRGGTRTFARALDGRLLDRNFLGAYVTPFDADEGHVAIYGENEFYRTRVFDWVPGTSRTLVAKNAIFVSIRDDLIFVRASGRRHGPTTLSAPGRPAWAEPFSPLAISPNGRTALGLRISRSGFNGPAVLDVRRMNDGRLLDSIAFGETVPRDNGSVSAAHEQTARWETNRRFVFQLTTPRGAVLVRCRLGGRCNRASDYGGNISTPYEDFMWW